MTTQKTVNQNRLLGPDCFDQFFGCLPDFPHIDHDPAIIKETVALEERLSKQTIQKILWDNPRRFYGL